MACAVAEPACAPAQHGVQVENAVPVPRPSATPPEAPTAATAARPSASPPETSTAASDASCAPGAAHAPSTARAVVTLAQPPVPKGCRGSDFDLRATSAGNCYEWFFSVPPDEALRDAMASVHGLVQASVWSLHAELQTESPRVRSGDMLFPVIVFTNTTHLPALVDFPDNVCFDVGAYVRGARVDRVVSGSETGWLCATTPSRVVLDPGGRIVRQLMFVAQARHVSGNDVVVDNLLPGKYELRVTVGHLRGLCPPVPTGVVATAPLVVD
jgi:hypothetical protein